MMAFTLALALWQDTGTVAGKVDLPAPPKSKLKLKYAGQSGASVKGDPAPSVAVVYLEKVPGKFEVPKEPKTIEQKGVEFLPRVLPVLKGTTVAFPNSDPIYHNVFSLSPTKKFDLGHYAQGESKSEVFDQPGVVKVYCEIHEHMRATVLVLENPYFATTDAEGAYKIENVPAGTYQLVAWHENSKELVRQAVEIKKGETKADLKFSAADWIDDASASPEAKPKSCCGTSQGG